MKENEIRKQFRDELEGLLGLPGLRIRYVSNTHGGRQPQPDILADVSYGDLRFRVVGEIVNHRSISALKEKIDLLQLDARNRSDRVPVIVAPYLSDGKRALCRERGMCYIDLSGNVFLVYRSIYVDRSGFPNRFPERRKGRGPFSDKASLILRHLLSYHGRSWGVRELAGHIGLDPGYISRMLVELEERRYILREKRRVRLIDPERVLDDWVHEYSYRDNREYRYFCLAQDPAEIMEDMRRSVSQREEDYALGIHAGAWLVSPHAVYNEVHVYLSRRESMELFQKRMELKDVESGANVVFLLPYYRHSVFYGKRLVRKLWVVSNLQLYLDLYHYPLRGLEQAEHLYERVLAREFGISGEND